MLYIYNTSSRQKELFKPICEKKVGLYVCGLTVYDDCHIGHGRLFIWFDVVVRYLRSIGYDVTYVRNITDIDDKIIRRAAELGIDYKDLTQRVINSMHADTDILGVMPPTFEPKVTDNIQLIIEMIKSLIDKGFAYVASTGDVYYEVAKFSSYGKLAHQDLSSLKAGIRVEVSEIKKDVLDFVLWKAAKPGEPSWESPWGEGRPGWHIECSVMAKKYLGNTFDIHGGGNDLQFPHHQNELAQSEAANGCCFVNYWMHMGFVQVDQEKMSKSLGNFFTLKDVLKKYHPEILRYFVVASHYRGPINFSENNLENAYASLQRFYVAIRDFKIDSDFDLNINNEYYIKFCAAMNDDFNTPEALAVLFELTREINKLRVNNLLKEAAELAGLLKYLGAILGLLQDNPDDFLGANINNDEISQLILARNEARNNKNWSEADKIRQQLLDMGVVLEDTQEGTKFRKV